MSDEQENAPARDDGSDEVSWRVIEPGLPVITSDGTRIGRVTHVLGDPERDIFDGVGFRRHVWTSHRMVPAGMITRITERAVYLGVSATKAEGCPAYEEVHVYRIGQTGFFRHHAGWQESDR